MKRLIRYRGKCLTQAPRTITDATTKRRIGHADDCDYRVFNNRDEKVAVYCRTLEDARWWFCDLMEDATVAFQYQIQKRAGGDWVTYRQLHQ